MSLNESAYPLVSVIIPTYNSENTLKLCLDSVINQSYHNLEILIVNDGSTDNSQALLDQYLAIDNRITIIKKVNEGLVLARKTGIDAAHGKYIQYLDSDDFLELDAIEALVIKAEETSADIVASPFVFCGDGKIVEAPVVDFTEVSGIDFLKMVLSSKAFWSVWSKFHLRSLYNVAEIERPDISLGEDVVLSTQLLVHASKVVSIKKIAVNYNFTSTSMSHPKSFNEKKYQDFKSYTGWVETYLAKKGLSDQLTKELAFFHLKNTFMQVYWKRFRDVNKEMERVVKDLKRYPDLITALTRRERKIFKAYTIAKWLGYVNLLRYNWQGKL